MKRRFDFIQAGILILFMMMSLLFTYWQYWPYKVITFNTPDNFPLLKQEYHPGEVLSYNVDIVQLTDNVKVEVIKQLEDGILINFTPTSYVTKKGRQQFLNSSLVIPLTAPPGKYRLLSTSIYHVNPIRTITITRTSAEFEIIN